MNRSLLLLVVFASLFISCGKNSYVGLNTEKKGEINLDRKVEMAAREAYSRYYPAETKSAGLTVSSISALADSSAFVIEFKEAGFVILENNPFLTPLVITEAGNFDDPQVDVARDMIDSIIRQLPGFDFPDDTIIQVHYTIDSTVVAPLIETNWHQRDPFNRFTPNGYAGCAPIAVAQAMGVFSSPSSLPLTYSGADVSVTPLDWDNMKVTIHWHPGAIMHHNDTCSYCTQLARLARQVGEILGSEYNNGNTGTDVLDIGPNLYQLGYTADEGSYQIDTVVNSLSRGFPVLLTGSSVYNGGSHIFDVFGSKIVDESYQIKVRENGVWTLTRNFHHIYTYLYCNFGEVLGLWNGWYLAHQKSYIYPEGIDHGWVTMVNTLSGAPYTNSAYMFYNFHPLNN